MPLTGDFARLKRLKKSVEQLGRADGSPQKSIARAVITEVRKGPLAEQYQTGVGPEGPWVPRKDGKPALVSRKLARTIRGNPVPGGALITWRSAIMLAHHEGHVFGPRHVAAGTLTFDKKMRLISARRQRRAKLVIDVARAAHLIRARVLVARRQVPRGSLPPRWQAAVELGLRRGMTRWGDRALKG